MSQRRHVPANTIADLARQYLGEEGASAAYLRQSWLARTPSALRRARRAAGLTQQQLADRLSTTQSAIARLEADDGGSMSLRRVCDYAIACGALPLDIALAPIEQVIRFAASNPMSDRTQLDLDTWQVQSSNMTSRPVSVAPVTMQRAPANALSSATVDNAADYHAVEPSGQRIGSPVERVA